MAAGSWIDYRQMTSCPSVDKGLHALESCSSAQVTALEPIFLPGAWALGDGLDMAIPCPAVPLRAPHQEPESCTWTTLLETLASALGMASCTVSHTQQKKAGTGRRSNQASSDSSSLSEVDAASVDSDCTESRMRTSVPAGNRRPYPYYEKED